MGAGWPGSGWLLGLLRDCNAKEAEERSNAHDAANYDTHHQRHFTERQKHSESRPSGRRVICANS